MLKKILKKIYHTCHLEKPYAYTRYFFAPIGHFRNFVSFPVGSFLRSHGICCSKDKEILKLKNKHLGKRVFIVCSGPSLTPEDVLLLKNDYTIGMNTIFRMSEIIDWKPSYYLCLEANGLDKFINNAHLDLKDVSTEYSIINSLELRYANDPKILILHYCWLDHYFLRGSKKFKYDPELFHGMYDFYSSGHAAVLLAIYMGFKDIYVIGADNNYMGKQAYFANINCEGIEEGYTEAAKNDIAYRSQVGMDMGWQELAKIAKLMGVNVYNATRGGRLEVFPRVVLEDIL